MNSKLFRLIVLSAVLLMVGWPSVVGAQEPEDKTLIDSVVQETWQHVGYSKPSVELVLSNVEYVDNWAFGTVAIPLSVDKLNETPQAFFFLAKKTEGNWQVAIEATSVFQEWLQQTPETLINSSLKTALDHNSLETFDGQMGNGSAQLSLPWATGETWTFSGGPHDNSLGAVDFAGGSGNVRAAREGVVSRPCANWIYIQHADGWRTGYYHITNISVAHGQSVSRGTLL